MTEVRKAKPEDIDVLMGLWWELIRTHLRLYGPIYTLSPGADSIQRKHLLDSIQSIESTVFVAETDGTVVGCLTVTKQSRPPVYAVRSEAKVNDVFVSEKHRDAGVASALLSKAEEWAKNQNLKYLSLDVNSRNKSAIGLYRKSGFKKFHIGMVKEVG